MENIGDYVIGTVQYVKPYALFLTFENGNKGLLHISEISDCFVKDIEDYGTIGDQIKVKIINIDPKNGFLRVSLKQVPESEKFSTHQERSGYEIPKSLESFQMLKDNLPKWISTALERTKKND